MKWSKFPGNHGQSLVETALILPLMLLIAVFVIDFGRGIYYFSAVYNASREGARYGIINPDNYAGIDNAARRLTIGLDPSQLFVDTYVDLLNDSIRVEVCYQFRLVTPLAQSFITDSPCVGAGEVQGLISLSSSATMALER